MKKISMVAAMMLMVFVAEAQDRSYWVVETNVKSANKSIVRIYSSENQLLQETTIDRNIDISKRKERRKLEHLLTATQRSASTVAVAKRKYNKLDDERPVIVE